MSTGPLIEELSWQAARSQLGSQFSEFVSIIDEIDPGPELTLIKVRYPFGALIVHNDTFYLPTEDGGSKPMAAMSISIPTRMLLGSPIMAMKRVRNRLVSRASWSLRLMVSTVGSGAIVRREP